MTTTVHSTPAGDLTEADWFTSSYSGTGTNCVEVADLTGGSYSAIAVRDSKDRSGPALLMRPEGWSAFVSAVKRGEFAG